MKQNETHGRSKLKGLYSYKVQLETKLLKLEKQVSPLQLQVDQVKERLESVNKSIEKCENRPVTISRHCIQRYRQRVNPDATEEEIRTHLLIPETEKLIRVLGGGGIFLIAGGLQIVLQDYVILTCEIPESKEEKDKRKTKYRRRMK